MTDQSGDSELRRRAAWLLAMLALVAGLFVVLFTTLLGGGGGGGSTNQAGPDDSLSPSPSSSRAPGSSSSASATSPSTPATSAHPDRASCPTSSTCALDYDIGNAVAAINDYRKRNDKDAVPGKVSSAAAECARRAGDGDCPDGWSETEVARPTGKTVVDKLEQRANLDGSMSSFDVGWAFDPGSKEYSFVVVVHGG